MTARSFTEALAAEPLDVDALAELEAAATPGPWGIALGDTIATGVEQVSPGGYRYEHIIARFADTDYDDDYAEPREVGTIEDDAALIAAARNALPALIEAVRQRDSARDWAAALENRIARALDLAGPLPIRLVGEIAAALTGGEDA